MLYDYFRISTNNFKRRKLRSWLTMLGIFIGIAAVVALISLGQGLQTAITGQFTTLSTDKLTIQNAGAGFGPPGSTVVEKLNNHDFEVVRAVNGVDEAVPRLVRVVKAEYNKKISFYYVGDLPEEKERREIVYDSIGLETNEGRLLDGDDFGKVLLGKNIAKGDDFDKRIGVGRKIELQGEKFEVIGILEEGDSFQINDVIIMLNGDLEKILDIDDEIDLIIAQISDGEEPRDVAEKIKKALRNDRNLKIGEEDFSVQTPIQAISAVNDVLLGINIVIIGIAMVSLVVGGIGIANTMYTSVLERKKEIGTMKAVGAKNSDVLSIFLIESGLLGFIGGLIGVIIGATLALGVSAFANNFFGAKIIDVSLSFPLILFSIMFSFLIGILSGIIPSYQASKLSPVEALRG